MAWFHWAGEAGAIAPTIVTLRLLSSRRHVRGASRTTTEKLPWPCISRAADAAHICQWYSVGWEKHAQCVAVLPT